MQPACCIRQSDSLAPTPTQASPPHPPLPRLLSSSFPVAPWGPSRRHAGWMSVVRTDRPPAKPGQVSRALGSWGLQVHFLGCVWSVPRAAHGLYNPAGRVARFIK